MPEIPSKVVKKGGVQEEIFTLKKSPHGLLIFQKKRTNMKYIRIGIRYFGNLCKDILCALEEDYVYRMKQYGFDPEKDGRKTTTKDGKEIEYFIPKSETFGVDLDDKNLGIKEIIVNKNWG